MARRRLTRLELKMEDLQEYETARKQTDKKKISLENSDLMSSIGRPEDFHAPNFKITKEGVYDRIGFNPTTRNPS